MNKPERQGHTAIPWKADKWATGWTVSAPDSHYSVCHLEDCNNEEANADFIVKCANSHEKLISTLRNALVSIQVMSMPILDNTVANNEDILNTMELAIKEALKEAGDI